MPAQEIDVKEAVRITGYSRVWIYNLLFQGRIKFRKDPRRKPSIFIDRDSLLTYINNQGRPANETNS